MSKYKLVLAVIMLGVVFGSLIQAQEDHPPTDSSAGDAFSERTREALRCAAILAKRSKIYVEPVSQGERTMKRARRVRRDIYDAFVGENRRNSKGREAVYLKDLLMTLDLSLAYQDHMGTMLRVLNASDEDGIPYYAVGLSAWNLEGLYNTHMEKDINRMTNIIQNTQHPGTQASAPIVRQIVRETKEMWSFEHE